jgi:hypothetical protein
MLLMLYAEPMACWHSHGHAQWSRRDLCFLSLMRWGVYHARQAVPLWAADSEARRRVVVQPCMSKAPKHAGTWVCDEFLVIGLQETRSTQPRRGFDKPLWATMQDRSQASHPRPGRPISGIERCDFEMIERGSRVCSR